MEEGEKNPSRTWNHETFFTQKPEKSVEGKPYSRNTVKANSFRAGQIFFLVPFKESRFPLFGISIQAGKRSSRSITERSCATGIISFTMHKRPISSKVLHAANQLGLNAPESFVNSAWFNTIFYFGKRLRKERPWKPTRDETRWPLCTSQLKPPPFGSRGKIGDNRGIRSLLNNKLSPGGGSFDWFRLWVPSPRGAAVKRETGYQFFISGFQRWRCWQASRLLQLARKRLYSFDSLDLTRMSF